MSGGGTQSSLRKALGAIKDTTTVNLAKVNSDYKVNVYNFPMGSRIVCNSYISFGLDTFCRSWTSTLLKQLIMSSALQKKGTLELFLLPSLLQGLVLMLHTAFMLLQDAYRGHIIGRLP